MQRSVYKSSILGTFWYLSLLVFAGGLAGCGDNPDSKAAKEVRAQTEMAVKTAVENKDYINTQEKIRGAVVQNRPTGLTKDTALLASGNLAFAHGQQMRSELNLKMLPIRGSVTQFEKLLRNCEEMLVEKEKLSSLLAAGDQEIEELTLLINGTGETTGLKAHLQAFEDQADILKAERAALQTRGEVVQKILDDNQSKADNLLRQSELAAGDRRLSLEQEAFEILKDRKEHYIEFQAIENQTAVIDNQLELLNDRINLTQDSIVRAQNRIEEIKTADARDTLNMQIREIEESLGVKQQQMSTEVGQINAGYRDYTELAEQTLAVFRESVSEYEKVSSGDAGFMAVFGQAESAYQAALTLAEQCKTQKFLAERLEGLMGSSDPSMKDRYERTLMVPGQVQPDLKKTLFEQFDAAVSAYEDASSRAGRIGPEAQCSVMKSKLLALYSKMKLADLLNEYDLANETESLIDQLKEEGAEMGVCFTQSEAMQIVNSGGLNYIPLIPLNMQVFIEGKKQELSAWAGLPLSQREAAIDENLAQIEALTLEYGQDVAEQFDLLKQEMLAAKERGFEESSGSAPGGPGDPNSL